MNTIETTTGLTEQDITDVDGAVAAAKAKVAARKAAKATAEGENKAEAETPARRKYTPEERIERAKLLEKQREDRAATRKAESDKKKAEVQATRATPHMSKVEKAALGLAPMDPRTQVLFNEVKDNLDQTQIDTLLAHLSFHSRRSATEGSLEVKLLVGQRVRIVSGPAKLIGREGVVEKAQRIHCYVNVGGSKPAYLFNYNVEGLGEKSSAPVDTPTEAHDEVAEEAHDEVAEEAHDEVAEEDAA